VLDKNLREAATSQKYTRDVPSGIKNGTDGNIGGPDMFRRFKILYILQVHIHKFCVADKTPVKNSPGEIGLGELGPGEVGLGKIGCIKVGLPEVGLKKIGSEQSGP
jgi:hypothetical protein